MPIIVPKKEYISVLFLINNAYCMKLVRLLLLGWIVIFSAKISAQDIHFSLFHMSPLTLNPAQTGAFEGTARIGGIYRDQWASFLRGSASIDNPTAGPNQFKTTIFYVDAPIIRGFGKYDWVGVGYTSMNDKAGTLGLKKGGNLFSASYHRSLSKRNADNIITLGIQAGSITRSFDVFDNILLGTSLERNFSAAPGSPEDRGLQNSGSSMVMPEENFFDISAGLMLRSVLNDRTRLEVGIAGIHLSNAENPLLIRKDTTEMGQTITPDDDYKQPVVFNIHGRVRYQLTDNWNITPGLLVRTIQGSSPEAIIQAWAGRTINKDFDLNMGTAYRFGDAAQLLVGLDYQKDLRVALSYDVNLSSLNTVSNYQGGFELSAAYIIKLYKQPESVPTILCPKF